jgi:hypothetical protein
MKRPTSDVDRYLSIVEVAEQEAATMLRPGLRGYLAPIIDATSSVSEVASAAR